MQFAVTKGENELSELVSRLFNIKGRSAEATMKNAEAALLKANPHLTKINKLPEGTLIVIPDVPGTPSTRTAQTSAIGADLEAEARSALKQLGDVIVRSADDIEKVATATQDAIKNRELKELAAQFPEVRAQIDKTTEAVKNQLKDAKATASAEKEALAELQSALQKFSF